MADDKPQGRPVKLFITSCNSVYTGTNTRGDSYTIYEVQARTESGTEITDKKLRSFEDLPLGELLDLTATRFDSEKHGTSWTLARKNKVGSHQRINELTERVNELAGRVEKLEEAMQVVAHRDDLDDRFGADPPY